MKSPSMIRKWFKIKTSDITIVQFILEGYEGLATVSTIDPKTAIIQVAIMPDFLQEMEDILKALRDQFMMREIPSDSSPVFLC